MGNAFILTFFHPGLIQINQNKYRHHVKNLTAPTHFFLKKILAGAVLVIFVLSITSCKTCKCPAYSQNKSATEIKVSNETLRPDKV